MYPIQSRCVKVSTHRKIKIEEEPPCLLLCMIYGCMCFFFIKIFHTPLPGGTEMMGRFFLASDEIFPEHKCVQMEIIVIDPAADKKFKFTKNNRVISMMMT